MRNINRLNEEIARWAFEILFKTNKSWVISFTNPTAGPWKTIKAVSLTSDQEGEVYRFILEEDRPDIIMYNDELKAVIVIEAKDSLDKLMVRNQATKSTEVVIKLAELLHHKGGNEFWKGRENYKVILGLLWGSTECAESDAKKSLLYDYYQNLIENKAVVYADLIIGIETLHSSENLKCSAFYKAYKSQAEAFGKAIIVSLMQN